MGKKARERAERRRRPVVNDSRALTQLQRLNELVGQCFGDEPNCIEAVALFVSAAKDLGHSVRPRAVALAAQLDDSSVALGRRAMDAWGGDLEAFGDVTDELTGTQWDSAGHLVATYDAACWLFDPTLQQVGPRLGVPLPPLAAEVDSMDPDEGSWDFSQGRLAVRYYLAEDDESWREGYERSLELCRPMAGQLVGLVRSGAQGRFVRG